MAKDLISFKLFFSKFHINNNLLSWPLYSFSFIRILLSLIQLQAEYVVIASVLCFSALFYVGLPQAQYLDFFSSDTYPLGDPIQCYGFKYHIYADDFQMYTLQPSPLNSTLTCLTTYYTSLLRYNRHFKLNIQNYCFPLPNKTSILPESSPSLW